MKPVYKIETYTGVTLDHTITEDCLFLRVKSCLTDQHGTFRFELPGQKGVSKVFDDIALYDVTKIYLDYDTISASPLFVGRIENIESQWNKDRYMRVFTGRDQSEITARLIRHQYSTGGNAADSQVAKWAADCGLGTDITADATPVTIISNQSKYDFLMREICDYAATISKDCYVDIGDVGHPTGHLIWKTRPIRSVGVSALTVGTNILSYSLTRNDYEVYNRFHVFGASEPAVEGTSACSHSQYTKSPTDVPSNHDSWTESLDNWSVDSADDLADLLLVTAYPVPHVGTYAISGVVGTNEGQQANEWIKITRTISPLMIKDSAQLQWVDYWRTDAYGTIQNMYIDLLAPDTSNYFRYTIDPAHYPVLGYNTHMYAELGPANEAGSGYEKWVRHGDPSWYNIQGIASYKLWNNVADEYCNNAIDGLYFTDLRWQATDQDGDSQTAYGVRDMVMTDDKIHTNTEATNYAASVKARYKDAPIQLDVVTPLDTNLLIGDRIPITITNENLSAVNFDVIQVEHIMDVNSGFLTHAILTSKERTRSPLKTTDFPTYLRDIRQTTEDVVQGRRIVK